MPTKTAMSAVAETVPDQRLFWDRWHHAHSVASHVEHSESASNAFVEAVAARPGCDVLELGCGQGREAVSFAQHGLRVSAFDHSPVAIKTAEHLARTNDLHVDFRRHDLSSFPFPYGSGVFNGVFSHLSLHYFDDEITRRIFGEIKRVLKSQGVLFFTVRSIRDPLYGQGRPVGKDMFCRNGHVRHFFHEEYARILLSSWTIEYIEYYDTNDQAVNPGVFMRALAYAP